MRFYRDIFLMCIGEIIVAFALNVFVVNKGMYSGGVLGLCQIAVNLLKKAFPFLGAPHTNYAGVLSYIINIPLFIQCYRKLGKSYFFRNILCVTVQSVALTLIPMNLVEIHDTLVSIIAGGILGGIGAGIVFYAHGSGGGTDIIGLLWIQKNPNASIGKMTVGTNVLVYGLCAILFNIETAIQSIFYSIIYSILLDKIHSENIASEVLIFTKKNPTPIIKWTTKHIKRGMSTWNAIGEYTKENTSVLFTIVSKYEISELEEFINRYDENAFIVKVHDVSVSGNFNKKM
ncbi:MAG: YitT family protein [Lachnospiraceae bacterium]|nr:YitT family protein [Lachnospiraceae bacterium]